MLFTRVRSLAHRSNGTKWRRAEQVLGPFEFALPAALLSLLCMHGRIEKGHRQGAHYERARKHAKRV